MYSCGFCSHHLAGVQFQFEEMRDHLSQHHQIHQQETFLLALAVVNFNQDPAIKGFIAQIQDRIEDLLKTAEDELREEDVEEKEPSEEEIDAATVDTETSIIDETDSSVNDHETLTETTAVDISAIQQQIEEDNIDDEDEEENEPSIKENVQIKLETLEEIDVSPETTTEPEKEQTESMNNENLMDKFKSSGLCRLCYETVPEDHQADHEEMNHWDDKEALRMTRITLQDLTFNCSVDGCKIKFLSENLLNKHESQAHNLPRDVKCRLCLKSVSRKSLSHHMWMHKNRSCQLCHKFVTNEATKKAHLEKVHKDEEFLHKEISQEDLKIGCDDCNLKFVSKASLKVHRKYEHSSQDSNKVTPSDEGKINMKDFYDMKSKSYTCKLCHFRFEEGGKLRKHIELNHQADKELLLRKLCESDFTIPCDNCDLKFINERLLDFHRLRTHYQNEKKVPCSLCDKKINRYNYNKHKISHTSEKNFECILCYAKLKTKFNLKNHHNLLHKTNVERAIIEKGSVQLELLKYPCEQCDLKFISDSLVKIHLSQAHGVKQVFKESVECHLCYKTIRSKYNIRAHLQNVHKGDKNYWFKKVPEDLLLLKCTECEKMFISEESKAVHRKLAHLQLVSKGKECHICHFVMKNKSNMKSHLKKVHKKEKEYWYQTIPENMLKFECTTCGLKFISKSILQLHTNRHLAQKFEFLRKTSLNDETKKYQCKLCFTEFSLFDKLKMHFSSIHHDDMELLKKEKLTEEDMTFPCSQEACTVRLPSQSSISYHLKNVHNKMTKKINAKKKYKVKAESKERFCQLCGIMYKKPHFFQAHKKKVHACELEAFDQELNMNDLRFPCTESTRCTRRFFSENTLNYHKKIKHYLNSGTETYCKPCDYQFNKPKSLATHKYTIHKSELDLFKKEFNDEDFKYPCNECDNVFVSEPSLKFHMKKTHFPSQSKTHCNLCDYEFETYQKYSNHKYNIHGKERSLFNKEITEEDLKETCNVCERKFVSSASLQFHTRNIHSHSAAQRKVFKMKFEIKRQMSSEKHCKLCNITYKKPCSLMTHMKKVHSEELELFDKDLTADDLKYDCRSCDKKYASEITLNHHMKTKHYRGTQTRCELCSFEFDNPKTFLNHKHKIHKYEYALFKKTLIASEFVFQCRFCEKKFPSKPSQEFHERRLHETLAVKVKTSAECRLCYTNFGFNSNLQRHLETKHQEDIHYLNAEITDSMLNHPCSECHLKFISESLLNYHNKKQHNIQTSYCKLCKVKLDNPFKLETHKKKVHKDELEAFTKDIEKYLKVTCRYCKEKLLNNNCLKYHAFYKHRDDKKKPYSCDHCSKQFKYDAQMNGKVYTHMKNVHNVNNFNIDAVNTTVPTTNMTVENFMNFFNSLNQ